MKKKQEKQKTKINKNTDIYLVNSYGKTKSFFSLCNTVFLGGSIANKGGQNPLEPARFGAKIFHGPDIRNFKEVYQYLNSLNLKYCLVSITTTKEQSFFLNNYRCKLDKKERLPDMIIHSFFKYCEEPKLEEGYHKIFKIPVIPEFNSLDDITIFNQYFQ